MIKHPLHDYNIIILGGGIAGLTLACSLASANLRVAILEKSLHTPRFDGANYAHRVSAINLASRNIFNACHVWPKIARTAAFERMLVWDAKSSLQFDATEVGQPQLGFIVENVAMLAALTQRLHELTDIDYFAGVEAEQLLVAEQAATLTTNQGVFRGQLIIGAEGKQSWLRQQMGVTVGCQDYGHAAIVANVTTALPHQRTAYQRFLPNGPLAFLPLADEQLCSIVWSCPPEEVERLCALPEADFEHALAEAFEWRLGKVTLASPRANFPLQRQHAEQYVAPRLGLVGDAAHTVHPLAGLGLNLGIMDAACLGQVITEAALAGRDVGRLTTLRRYERWQRGHNAFMLSVISSLKQVYGWDSMPLQQLRGMGVNFIQQSPKLKQWLAQCALGTMGSLPLAAE